MLNGARIAATSGDGLPFMSAGVRTPLAIRSRSSLLASAWKDGSLSAAALNAIGSCLIGGVPRRLGFGVST